MKTRRLNNKIYLKLALGWLLLSAGADIAHGDDASIAKATIRYEDLNLATKKGNALLHARITGISYKLCRNYDRDSRDNADPSTAQACRKKVIAEAEQKIGRPTLYPQYHSRNAPPLAASLVTDTTLKRFSSQVGCDQAHERPTAGRKPFYRAALLIPWRSTCCPG